jgi:hypothetical protein
MANVALSIFLLLFGATLLIETKIPSWMVGLSAVIAGLCVGFGWFRKKSG